MTNKLSAAGIKIAFQPLVKRAEALGYQLKQIKPRGSKTHTEYRMKPIGGTTTYSTSSLSIIESKIKELEAEVLRYAG